MQLAHTLGAGGPEIEFLIIAVAMLVLGVVFFVQKSVKPAVPVILVIGAFAMTAGAFAAGGSDDNVEGSAGSSDAISISITSPEDGATVPAGEPVIVEIEVRGAPEGGHFDVRIDGDIATMTPESTPEVTFPSGEHELTVEYVNSRHQSFDPPVRTERTVIAE
jgi:hypothetical protein